MNSVERVDLAPGLSISRLLTGMWQIADMERDGETLDAEAAAAAMTPYAERGLTTFDMADHYGSAEVIAGAFRRSLAHPSAVQLLTKWVPKPGRGTKRDVRTAVERALQRLGTECLDLLQYHAWNYGDPSYLDDLFWLQELKAEGLIANLGMTNTDTAHLRVLVESGIEVATNQVCFSILDRRPLNRMCAYAVDTGVGLLCYGALAGGFLTDRWLGRAEPEWEREGTWSQMKYGRFLRVAGGWDGLQALLRAAREIADRHGVSIANVACRYVLQQPGVAGVIVGARLGHSEHIEHNLRIFDFELGPEELRALEAAMDRLTPIPGEPGDEYRKPPFLTASGDLSHHLDSLPAPYESVPGPDDRTRVLTGTVWEDLAGFSRAVRRGGRILVSGTTATHGEVRIGGTDPTAQTHFILDKIDGALQSLGASLDDVVRTRIYLDRASDWEAVSRAHGERLGHVQPANTMVQAGVLGEGYLVEIEAEADVTV